MMRAPRGKLQSQSKIDESKKWITQNKDVCFLDWISGGLFGLLSFMEAIAAIQFME